MSAQPTCKIRVEAKGGPCGAPAYAYFAATAPLPPEWHPEGGVMFTPEALAQLEEQLSRIPVCREHWEETGLGRASREAARHLSFSPTAQDRRL